MQREMIHCGKGKLGYWSLNNASSSFGNAQDTENEKNTPG